MRASRCADVDLVFLVLCDVFWMWGGWRVWKACCLQMLLSCSGRAVGFEVCFDGGFDVTY